MAAVEFRPPNHWRLLTRWLFKESALIVCWNWSHWAAGVEFYGRDLVAGFVGPLSIAWGRTHEVES